MTPVASQVRAEPAASHLHSGASCSGVRAISTFRDCSEPAPANMVRAVAACVRSRDAIELSIFRACVELSANPAATQQLRN
eukprot:7022827-Prymnesium_polylepis.1